jgi:hypothetical protein
MRSYLKDYSRIKNQLETAHATTSIANHNDTFRCMRAAVVVEGRGEGCR